MKLSDEIWQWIADNINGDPDRLRLAHHGNVGLMDAITQIDCRKRCVSKLSETLQRIPRFAFPNTLAAQQSTSDLLAEYHAGLVTKGDKVLDMTAGLCIDALHLSGRASSITACEIQPEVAQCAIDNFASGGIGNVVVRNCDSVQYISSLPDDSFDVIFIDPARRGEHGERLYALNQCAPDVTALLPEMLRVASRIIIKASPMLDISDTLQRLSNVISVIALGTPTECKELVIICSRELSAPTLLKAVTMMPDGDVSDLTFTSNEEAESSVEYGFPVAGHYLLEPYPAVMKIGANRLLSSRFGVKKIAQHTHLYTSPSPIDNFPGRTYEIIECLEFNKRSIKAISISYPRIDITTRNFGISAPELAKRLKVKSGSDHRLFALTDSDGRRWMLVCRLFLKHSGH